MISTFPAKDYNIDEYPAVRDYLLSFGRRKLAQTGEKDIDGIKGNNARKNTTNKWFETQDSIAYWDDFDRQYLAWSDISTEPQFTLIDAGTMINNTAYMIVGDDLDYLTAVLNSKLIAWYFPKIASDLGSSGVRYFKQFVELIPIPTQIGICKLSADHSIYKLYNLTQDEISFIESLNS